MEEALDEFGNDIEVVFCNNDAMALGALEAIREADRTVGEDIYLTGWMPQEAVCECCKLRIYRHGF